MDLFIDNIILSWINQYAGQSASFDLFVGRLASSGLAKGVPIAMLFLFLWFLPRADQIRTRVRLLALLAISVVAIGVGRIAAVTFPYRPRPLHNEALDLQLPLSIKPVMLDGWSSFPSDHAVFYAALATGFWMINRWAGLLATLHALIVIAFARVYLTLHYPTDILGGAVIGLAVSLILMPFVAKLIERIGIAKEIDKWPQYFHPFLFFVLFQIATMFDSLRAVLHMVTGFIT